MLDFLHVEQVFGVADGLPDAECGLHQLVQGIHTIPFHLVSCRDAAGQGDGLAVFPRLLDDPAGFDLASHRKIGEDVFRILISVQLEEAADDDVVGIPTFFFGEGIAHLLVMSAHFLFLH